MADGVISHKTSKKSVDCFDKFLYKIGIKWKQYLEEDIFKRGIIKDKFFDIKNYKSTDYCTLYLYIPDCYLEKSKTKSNTHIHLFYEERGGNLYLGYSFKYQNEHPIEQNYKWRVWKGSDFKENHTNETLIRDIVNELIITWARFITFPCKGERTGGGNTDCFDEELIKLGNIWRDFTMLIPEMTLDFYRNFLDKEYQRRVIEVSRIDSTLYKDGFYMVSTYDRSPDCHLYLYLPLCYSLKEGRNRSNSHIHVYYKKFKGYRQTWIGINIKLDDKRYVNDPMFFELRHDYPSDMEIKEIGMGIIAKFQELVGFPCEK
jgi:hypothetical protein